MCRCVCTDCHYVLSYPDLPALMPLPDKTENWRLECHFLTPLVNGRALLLRRGLVTDGASIPRLAWRVIGHPFSKDLLPHALGHDGAYAAELMTRTECDDWFLTSMAMAESHYALSVGWTKRNAVWSAVRVGGSFVWSRHTDASIAEARRYVSVLNVRDFHTLRASRDIRSIEG